MATVTLNQVTRQVLQKRINSFDQMITELRETKAGIDKRLDEMIRDRAELEKELERTEF
jgi:hypothetical protein